MKLLLGLSLFEVCAISMIARSVYLMFKLAKEIRVTRAQKVAERLAKD